MSLGDGPTPPVGATTSSAPAPRRGGWTIVEMAVALAVLGLLVAIARPLYTGYRERALVGQAISDLSGIQSKIALHEVEFGQPPATLNGLMNPMPVDPWGNPYRYLKIVGAPPSIAGQVRKDKNLVPINTDYDLYSTGPDGQSVPALTAQQSQDDIVRANDGAFVGRAVDY